MLDLPMNRIVLALAVIIGLLAALRHFRTDRAVPAPESESETGHIAPNHTLLAVVCLVGVALAVSALAAFFRGTGGLALLAVAATALAMTGLMLTAFSSLYDITWNEDGIEGPALMLPHPFGPKRTKMFWEDIERATDDHGRRWGLEDRHGNRIMWSFIYSGRPALMARIQDECPWLFTNDTKAHALPDAAAKAVSPVKPRFIKQNFATAKSA